jgi:hypothetical protein
MKEGSIVKKKFIKVAMATTIVATTLVLGACGGGRSTTETTTVVNAQESVEAALETMETGGAHDKVPDPNAPDVQPAMLYYVNEDGDVDNEFGEVEGELTAESLLAALAGLGVVDSSVEVLSFEYADGVGTLDLSDAPADEQTLTAIAKTFTMNFELDSISITVNGSNISF